MPRKPLTPDWPAILPEDEVFGWDFPDASSIPGELRSEIAGSGIDPNIPQFQAGQTSCQKCRHDSRCHRLRGQSPAAPNPFDQRDRFAAYVAHELRTPIALQLALAEVALADPDADTVALRATCEDIVAGCEQQQRLIEALLDLTRGQRGLTRREPVDIASITSQALQAHELSELESTVALEPAVATGDPILVERLAANLISNATRHNIPHGRIEVATRAEAGRALLSVANTGPVIPAGELTRLFQPFERLGSHPQACGDGIGLGLAIVQSIADAHKATVAAHPRAHGGLEIEVRFPASASTRGAPSDEGGCAG